MPFELFGAEHVARYEATDGRVGHDWEGAHVLVLTTTGRRTGRPRKAALVYGERGDDLLIVASRAGAPEPPAWYLNLVAEPRVAVQVWGERFAARARVATAEEKPALWDIMLVQWPGYDDFQARTQREIPVVVLERG